jgi:hypothetical protein
VPILVAKAGRHGTGLPIAEGLTLNERPRPTAGGPRKIGRPMRRGLFALRSSALPRVRGAADLSVLRVTPDVTCVAIFPA